MEMEKEKTKKRITVWSCDICKVAKFQDYDEACRHEAQCEGAGTTMANNTNAMTMTNTTDGTNASGDVKTATTRKRSDPTTTSSTTSITTTTTSNKEEAVPPKKKKQKSVPIASIFNTGARKTNSNNTNNKILKDNNNNNNTSSSSSLVGPPKTKQSKASSSSSAAAKTSSNNNNNNKQKKSAATKPLAAIFQTHKKKDKKKDDVVNVVGANDNDVDDNGTAVDLKALMAEQRAVEFQAKGRLQRERERERQRKREEDFASSTDDKSNHNSNSNNMTTCHPQKKPSKFSICPRFPVPSYILPSSTREEEEDSKKITPTTGFVSVVSEEQLEKARSVLQKELPFPSQKPTLPLTSATSVMQEQVEEECEWQWTYNYDPHPTQTQTLSRPTRQDLESDFAKQFANLLQRTATTTSTDADATMTNRHNVKITSRQTTQLWGDASALIDMQDICGAHNQQVANELVAFVREWMVLRQAANQRMAARQKALQMQTTKRTQKKRKKKKQYDDDDDGEDLWFDSDNEEDVLPPRICLIEGPVGSCKSSLVHAVARHCDCQVVELNTSDKRGSADIKKVLEEATTSHSSLAMFKNRQAAAAASLFTKQTKRQELVDSDSECDSDTEGVNGNSSKKKGCSLTIILIDEADNIFETCGDAGFWSALNDLARKAQCPIFLTANSAPKQLDSMLYKYVATSRPTPSECAEKISQVLAREGVISDRQELGEWMIGLESLAELYGCDLRRILHRIQFLCSAKVLLSGDDQKELSRLSHVMSRKESPPVVEAITIDKVSPRTVSSETQTLLKIKGTNFDRLKHLTTMLSTLEVRVFVGDQLCPAARIVDDKTIFAVCPPLGCDLDVDKFGMRNNHRESLDARFAPLSVQSVHAGSSLLVSSSSLFRNTLLDDTVLGCVTPYNVERCFPEEEDCSDVEFDDEGNLASRPSCLLKRKCVARVSIQSDKDAMETADRLIRDELKSMKSTTVGEEGTRTVDMASVGFGSSGDSNDKELETLADDLQLASDASLLDDYACIPFLSGASLGFGYQFTPEGLGSQGSSSALKLHGNSTHCSEERLFSLGWKDTSAFYGDNDAWVSQPMLARDRKLVHAAVGSRLTHAASLKSSTGAADETIDSDLTLWSPQSSGNFEDDDCYLPRPTPTPLLSLSSLLLDAQKFKDRVTTDLNDDVLQKRKEVNLKSFLETSNILFSRESQARMHWKGVVDPSPCEKDCDTSLLLDYFPVLRSIAVLERAAQSIDDSGSSDASRRRTRKSAKRGRSHYFESLNFLIRWGEEGAPSAVTAGETFAKSLLTL